MLWFMGLAMAMWWCGSVLHEKKKKHTRTRKQNYLQQQIMHYLCFHIVLEHRAHIQAS